MKKILIVEDELALLQLLEKTIKRAGFDVMIAKDGVEGLKKAKAGKPNLILLDIIMPKMDGFTMLKRLKQERWGKNIPVIILTNLSEGEKIATAIETGVFDYLVKSNWQLKDVVKKIKEKLPKE